MPEGEEDALDQQGNVEAPDVELAGVVITPDVRVATLRLKGEAESLLALEGEPLHGSFGSWRVSRIEPRSALLESANGEQVELQLQIHDAETAGRYSEGRGHCIRQSSSPRRRT